jgi:hypothetical protein
VLPAQTAPAHIAKALGRDRHSGELARCNPRAENDKREVEAPPGLAGAVTPQTVADQTKNFQQLKRGGYPLSVNDAKHVSSPLTRQLLQFGPCPLRGITEPLPDNRLEP